MIIEKIPLAQCQEATGFLVVIDVLRAFTTAAYAFGAGAAEIHLVGTVEQALALKAEDPSFLLMGEVNGKAIPGFDFGNSPVEVAAAKIQGKKIVQRTSAGTQGVVLSRKADEKLAASFAVAEATLKEIQRKAPSKVTFVITGWHDGDEDLALADYLEERLKGKKIDPSPYLKRVIESLDAKTSIEELGIPGYQEDVNLAIQIDYFPFAMRVFANNVLKRL